MYTFQGTSSSPVLKCFGNKLRIFFLCNITMPDAGSSTIKSVFKNSFSPVLQDDVSLDSMTDRGGVATEKSQIKAEREMQEGTNSGTVPGAQGGVAVHCVLWYTKEGEAACCFF